MTIICTGVSDDNVTLQRYTAERFVSKEGQRKKPHFQRSIEMMWFKVKTDINEKNGEIFLNLSYFYL